MLDDIYSHPKRLFFGELKVGERSQGGQRKRCKDTLKVSLKSCGINHNTWEDAPQSQSRWHSPLRYLELNSSRQRGSTKKSAKESQSQ